MLVYVSVEFFRGTDTNKISAFGSVLGGVGTIFAGFIAIYLFNDWKIQHNKQVINNFGLQVYEQFSNFENHLSTYQQYLKQLDDLIGSYDYEVNSAILYAHNNFNYISNITITISELEISFNCLYSKFQAYSIVSGTLVNDSIRYDSYLCLFKDINLFNDEIFHTQQNLNTWRENHNKTLELTNQIKTVEIDKLLVNLKAD